MTAPTCKVCERPIHLTEGRWFHDQPYDAFLPPIHAPRPRPIGAADLLSEIVVPPWPAPDPATRVPMHGCDWIECPRTDTKRYGYWGQYIYGCPEHGPLVGDDGSMDDPYDDEVFICPVCKGTRTIQPDRASPPEECPRCVDPDEGA